MPNPPSLDDTSSQPPHAEPWANTPNALRNVLIEIADLRSENQALHDRVRELFSRLRELCAARGLPPPKFEDL